MCCLYHWWPSGEFPLLLQVPMIKWINVWGYYWRKSFNTLQNKASQEMLQLQSTTFSLHLYLILICSNFYLISNNTNTKMEVILAAMNTTEVVVEIRPEKMNPWPLWYQCRGHGFKSCTGIAEVMGSNPILAWIFSGLISTTSSVVQ